MIDLDMLSYLFIEFAGGADIDSIFNKYGHLDLEKIEDRKIVINELKNHYTNNFDDSQKNDLCKLMDYLIKEDINIDREINSELYPFDFPKDKRTFFIEIKEALNLGSILNC